MGWEGLYEVSSHGRVRSLDRRMGNRWGTTTLKRGTTFNPYRRKKGYVLVQLTNPRESVEMQRLVLKAFEGEPPAGKPFALHNDGNPGNNHLRNLRWGSRIDNAQDSLRHGTHHGSNLTSCKYGHEYTEENTLKSGNSRYCRACRRVRESTRQTQGLTPGDTRHGTLAGYTRYGCRCLGCSDARREYMKGWAGRNGRTEAKS